MKCFRISVTPAHGAAYHYFGLFTDGFAAVIDGMSRTIGQKVRISAKVLP